jgi:hypothetical protein
MKRAEQTPRETPWKDLVYVPSGLSTMSSNAGMLKVVLSSGLSQALATRRKLYGPMEYSVRAMRASRTVPLHSALSTEMFPIGVADTKIGRFEIFLRVAAKDKGRPSFAEVRLKTGADGSTLKESAAPHEAK